MSTITGITNIAVTGSQGTGELFISLYKWLTTSGSTIAGIKLIANSTGSTVQASAPGGFNYPNQPNPIGNNAWAVFAWTSASLPFYALLQVATGTSTTPFGAVPGNPAVFPNTAGNYAAYGGIGLQIAMRADGGNPWNGTSGALGSDTKGSTVWSSSSLGGTVVSPLYVWPRCNSVSGNFETNKQKLLPIAAHAWIAGPSANGNRVHAAADFENFGIARDTFNTVNSYNYFWFGRYEVYDSCSVGSGRLSPNVPYAMFFRDGESSDPTIAIGATNVYGSATGDTDLEGGIAHSYLSGVVVGCSLDTLAVTPFASQYNPNRAYPTAMYDEYPVMLFMNESSAPIPQSWGMLGQTSFLRFIYNAFVGDTNANLSRVVLGSNPLTQLSSKFTFPWSSNAPSILSSSALVSSRSGTIY